MKLWSRGLGKTELNMDFRYYQVKKDPATGNVLIIGKITDPVNWEFRITIGPEDIPGLIKIFLNYCVILMAFKNMYKYLIYLFNRKKYQEAAGYDIEKQVNDAYSQMMNERKRPTLLKVSND